MERLNTEELKQLGEGNGAWTVQDSGIGLITGLNL